MNNKLQSISRIRAISEDLEEEIENYIKDSLAIKFPTTDKEQIKADIRYIARHFAEWQKQQMMKDVVEGDIYKNQEGEVKIIVVKED